MAGTFQQIIDGLKKDLKTLNSAKITAFLKNFPAILKNSSKQAQYGYYAIFAGIFLILLQMVLWVF